MAFPFLFIFIVFLLFLAYRYKSTDQHSASQIEDFWDKELEANATRKKDISSLSYINIPLDKFPINFTNDPEIVTLENQLQELSKQRIVNFTGITNTDLKLTYGVPHFNELSEMGERFDTLTVVLKDYATALIRRDMVKEAIAVLEYSVVIKSDIGSIYTMLGDCYLKQNQPEKIDLLITQVEQSTLPRKESIIRHLQGLHSTES